MSRLNGYLAFHGRAKEQLALIARDGLYDAIKTNL